MLFKHFKNNSPNSFTEERKFLEQNNSSLFTRSLKFMRTKKNILCKDLKIKYSKCLKF